VESLESLVPGDPWVIPEFRVRRDQEDFLDCQVFLGQMDPQVSRETEGYQVTLDPLGWDMKDLLVPLALMGPLVHRVLESLVLRDFVVLLANMDEEECQAALALWVHLDIASSVRPFRCRPTGGHQRRGHKQRRLLVTTLPMKLPKGYLLTIYKRTLYVILNSFVMSVVSFVIHLILILCLSLVLVVVFVSSIKICGI